MDNILLKETSIDELRVFFNSLDGEQKLAMFGYDLVKKAEFVTVEKVGKEIAGIIGIWKTNRYLPTLFIVVKERYQGKGVGNKLMSREIEYAKISYDLLTLSTYNNGKYDQAIHLYRKFGFQVYLRRETKIWMCTAFNFKGKIICKFLPIYHAVIYYLSYFRNSIRDIINSITRLK